MDDKWRIVSCTMCYAGTKWSFGDEGPVECSCSGGVVYLRPKGHAFAWPGGPAIGWWTKEEYDSGTPVMPWDWHTWTETDEDLDRFEFNFQTADYAEHNIVHCSCGWQGTIAENKNHVELMEEEFIRTHKAPVA